MYSERNGRVRCIDLMNAKILMMQCCFNYESGSLSLEFHEINSSKGRHNAKYYMEISMKPY